MFPIFLGSKIQRLVKENEFGVIIGKAIFIPPKSRYTPSPHTSHIGKLRDELLNGEVLDTLMEAKLLVKGWRKEYNRFRPHSSLGYRPPAPEAFDVEKLILGLVH
jgi:putative transposase